MEVLPESFFRIQWIPRHLREENKRAKKLEAIEKGITDEWHIAGNHVADRLADGGASMHAVDPFVVTQAGDRAELTALVQVHLVLSWANWVDITKEVKDIADAVPSLSGFFETNFRDPSFGERHVGHLEYNTEEEDPSQQVH